ncbi:TOBE domain-containing protein [Dichotomicrobium thermohalophilum]|uniref:Molybdopterin-binding protein n=1 Tax=Dichotomicrobium thermohalophilum TaxID=933063 RepID=A0A397Q4Q1_9HYPH|nr:TOBE domain-containing protein [Dichotomicrobium thermohalophilum]RIA56018.1 molybdopterin-binding protein [Dichotomicrobium thermohalophilum]
MKLSARNRLKGTVSSIKEGPVNSQVQVDIGGGNVLTSMVTSDAVADLGLSEGKEVYVIIKASQVMLGAE